MSRECGNNGGARSVVRLDRVPRLEEEVELAPEAVASLGCWQPRLGEIFTVVDPEQSAFRARLVTLDGERAAVVPFARLPRTVESGIAIELYQALPEKERFELILQKATELGVARLVPYTSERSTTLAERDAGQKKSHRWPDVILRAARQCRRAMIPELSPVLDWDEATYAAAHCDLKLMLFEGEAPWRIGEVLAGEKPARVALLVGPEGGFCDKELDEARALGFVAVSIGPRVLRTETAAIVGASLVQYELGDLG